MKKKNIKVRIVSKIGKKVQIDYGGKCFYYLNTNEFKRCKLKIKKNKIFKLNIINLNNSIRFSLLDYFIINELKKLKKKIKSKEIILGKIEKKVRGGFSVSYKNIKCFLPGSLLNNYFLKNINNYFNKDIYFEVIKVDLKNINVVLSKKKIYSKKYFFKKKIFSSIRKNEIINGVIKKKTKNGALVNYKGFNCLLHFRDVCFNGDLESLFLNVGKKMNFLVKKKNNLNLKVNLCLRSFTKLERKKGFSDFNNNEIVKCKYLRKSKKNLYFRLNNRYIGLLNISNISYVNYSNILFTLKNKEINLNILRFNFINGFFILGFNNKIYNPYILLKDYYLNKKINCKFYKNIKKFSLFKLPFLSLGICKKKKFKKKKYSMILNYVNFKYKFAILTSK